MAAPEAAEILQRYLQFDTSNPPGRTLEAARYLQSLFEGLGIEARLYAPDEAPEKATLLAILRPPRGPAPGAGPLLLTHHIDVVPAEPGQWKAPPFSGEIRDGELWGRGALDTKGLGIMQLIAMARLRREPRRLEALNRDILYLALSDEETGGEWGARWMVERHWGDIAAEAVINEGGFGSRGILTPDERTVFGVSTCEKQALWLKLVARGRPGHGSMPPERSAVDRLLSALRRLKEWPQADTELPVITALRARLGALKDSDYTRALRKNTVTVTSLVSGVGRPPKVNVIPSEASATVDCRLLPGSDPGAALERIREIAREESVDLEIIKAPEPVGETPAAHPLYSIIEKAFEEERPGSIVAPMLLSGATDSRFFRVRGAAAFGIGPFLLREEDLSLIHGPDERIRLADLEMGVRVFDRILRGYCEGGRK